jgi:hypothetical protein
MNALMRWMIALVATMIMVACDVEQTEEGEMPNADVEGGQLPEYEQTQEGELPDVNAEGGDLPEYDVDAPDVDVGTEKKEITVPDVDVNEDEQE